MYLFIDLQFYLIGKYKYKFMDYILSLTHTHVEWTNKYTYHLKASGRLTDQEKSESTDFWASGLNFRKSWKGGENYTMQSCKKLHSNSRC